METEKITVRVTPKAARIYGSATDEERTKLDLLISLKIGEANDSSRSLKEILDDVRSQAALNGLSAETIQDFLE
jgi:hypothetical protein